MERYEVEIKGGYKQQQEYITSLVWAKHLTKQHGLAVDETILCEGLVYMVGKHIHYCRIYNPKSARSREDVVTTVLKNVHILSPTSVVFGPMLIRQKRTYYYTVIYFHPVFEVWRGIIFDFTYGKKQVHLRMIKSKIS